MKGLSWINTTYASVLNSVVLGSFSAHGNWKQVGDERIRAVTGWYGMGDEAPGMFTVKENHVKSDSSLPEEFRNEQ